MKLNKDKCHVLFADYKHEAAWVNVVYFKVFWSNYSEAAIKGVL